MRRAARLLPPQGLGVGGGTDSAQPGDDHPATSAAPCAGGDRWSARAGRCGHRCHPIRRRQQRRHHSRSLHAQRAAVSGHARCLPGVADHLHDTAAQADQVAQCAGVAQRRARGSHERLAGWPGHRVCARPAVRTRRDRERGGQAARPPRCRGRGCTAPLDPSELPVRRRAAANEPCRRGQRGPDSQRGRGQGRADAGIPLASRSQTSAAQHPHARRESGRRRGVHGRAAGASERPDDPRPPGTFGLLQALARQRVRHRRATAELPWPAGSDLLEGLPHLRPRAR